MTDSTNWQNAATMLNAAEVDGVQVYLDSSGELHIDAPEDARHWKSKLGQYGDILAAILRGEAPEPPDDAPEAPQHPLTTSSLDYLHKLVDRLERREGDILFDAGDPFGEFECGPGLLTVLAAGPGAGKTTLAMQYALQALEHMPELRVTVANAETGFEKLLKRELTRRSGVPSKALRFADLTQTQMEAVEQAAAAMEPLLQRVDVFEPPYSLPRIKQLLDVPPGLLVLDYLQKFSPPDKEPRVGANLVASSLRHLCHGGWGVLALSATSRQRGKGGSDHNSESLNLASLKESGEIEFNADAVYLLRDKGPVDEDDKHVVKVEVDCVKNRNGKMGWTDTIFDKPRLQFRAEHPTPIADGDFGEWTDTDDGNPFDEEAA